MSSLWRTPTGLRSISWSRAVLVALAAFIAAPFLGRLLYAMNHWTGLNLPALEIVGLLMGVSFFLSWAGYLICVPVAMWMVRNGHGGALPITALGAIVGAVLLTASFWGVFDPYPSRGLRLGAAVGSGYMLVWWGGLFATARHWRPKDAASLAR